MGSTIALAEATATEQLFLPEGWEIKLLRSELESDLDVAAAPAAQLISADEKTGEVMAIVGITGIVDHVQDLIEVGAYADTLVKRRPKVCWAHSWEAPIGKVLAIEEWKPGDKRFAEVKATLDGKPWPAEAGALVASMRMNMKSDRGREAFAAVEFYSESGECEWSIGWQPVAGHTVRRKDGVRVCRKVELYEVSPVLFGAAPLTRTLEVKSIRLDDARADTYELKAGQPAGPEDDDADDDADGDALHAAAMNDIDWAEVDAAAAGEQPDVKALDDDLEPGQVRLEAKMLDLDPLNVDLDALAAALQVKAGEGGADRNRGGAEHLRRWYEKGEGAAKIRWGQPGDFGRCVRIAGKHMDPERAKGYCNLRHKGATGVYPGQHKSAGVAAAEALAGTWSPLLEVGAEAAGVQAKALTAGVEVKDMGERGLTGSFEERQRKLQVALAREFRARRAPVPEVTDSKQPGPSDGWANLEGTWDDHAIVTWVEFRTDDTDRSTFRVPYTWTGDDVELGELEPVELQVSVVPVAGGTEPTAAELDDTMVGPGIDAIDSGVMAVKSLLTHAEVKAGRVLSEANASRLKGALEHLLEVARAAGIHLPGWTGPETPAVTAGDAPARDTTAPGTEVKRLSIADFEQTLDNFL